MELMRLTMVIDQIGTRMIKMVIMKGLDYLTSGQETSTNRGKTHAAA
jgi:hypothetical protein